MSTPETTETAPRTIFLPCAGEMGAGLGRILVAAGARVLTNLDGRSAATVARAEAAGMIPAGPGAAVEADVILSVVPPAIAVEMAERVAALVDPERPPLYVDLNAVAPETSIRIGRIVIESGARFSDGSIIGGPPAPGGRGPRLYVSGPGADEATELNRLGLEVIPMDGDVGAASALKMCYGALTKGLVGLLASMLAAAERAGVGAELHSEMSDSQPALLARAERNVPGMYPKAYRWIDEMQQVASFLGHDRPESGIWRSLADLYEAIADDEGGGRELKENIGAFLDRRNRGN